jgi:hypothetical protein
MRTGGDPALQVIVDAYFDIRVKNRSERVVLPGVLVSPDHARKLDRVLAIVELWYGLWRAVSYFDSRWVEDYLTRRTSQAIRFPKQYQRRECRPVEMRTAVAELKDFAGVLEWARKQEIISHNPLHGYEWKRWLQGDQHAVVHMEEAHTRRYQLLLARPQLTDSFTGVRMDAPIHRIACVDGGARARITHALLFHHGHRLISTRSILCEDVALTPEETRALLRLAPNHREWWADHFPHGGILWRRSKVDYLRFTPFSRAMRIEMDRWRAHHPGWRAGMPLIPSISDSARPVAETSVREWTQKAFAIIREDLGQSGVPAEQVSRWLSGSILHGYRDHWATIMDQLGYGWDAAKQGSSKLDLHNHVAFLGDWKTAGGTQAEIYAKLHPGILQAIMEFERAEAVYARFSSQAADELEGVLSAIHEENDVIPIDRVRRR